MNCPPLQYNSMKCVLETMQAERRFDLALHSPSIRKAEKATPLKIDKLSLNELGFTVNGTEYKVGVVKCHKDGKAKFCQHDLNPYGFKESRKPPEPTPEEYRIDTRGNWEQLVKEENYGMRLNYFLASQAKELVEKNRKIGGNKDIDEKFVTDLLAAHQLQQYKSDPPFTLQIETHVGKRGEKLKKEVLEYKRSVHDVMRALVFNNFGGRKEVYVETLRFRANGFHRYPAELKLRIKNLEVIEKGRKGRGSDGLSHVLPLLDISSFPLETITTDSSELNEPEYQECKLLILRSSLVDVTKIKNNRVHFEDMLSQENTLRLLDDWKKNGKEIGAHFTFKVCPELSFFEIIWFLQFFGKLPGARTKVYTTNRWFFFHLRSEVVYIPINDVAEVELYYEGDPETCKKAVVFHMEVKPREEETDEKILDFPDPPFPPRSVPLFKFSF